MPAGGLGSARPQHPCKGRGPIPSDQVVRPPGAIAIPPRLLLLFLFRPPLLLLLPLLLLPRLLQVRGRKRGAM